MSDWVFGATVQQEQDGFLVRVRDLPEVMVVKPTEAEALASAERGIELAFAFIMRKGEGLAPSTPVQDGERPIPMSIRFAAKVAIYEAWKAAGITKVELAARMGRKETEVRRVLDLNYPTGMDHLVEAAKALGKRFTIGLSPV